MKLDHINIKAPIALLEREKNFFCDVLGLKEGKRPDFAFRGYWLYAGDQPVVHLSESDAHGGDGAQAAIDHVAFRSSGLDTFVQVLAEKEIEYRAVYVPDLDMTQVFFRAPSDTKIEVNFLKEQL
jgi:catechol 2,3-dioxygenase-like lactoylglutathione lyase family enzyme